MKKILLIAFTIFLCSCAKDIVAPRAVIVPPIAPKVEKVVEQAKISTSHAEKTEELASLAAEKYKSDPFILEIKEAAKSTVIQSKKTEFELAFLQEYAKSVDIKADELENTVQKQEEVIIKKEAALKKGETTIIEQKAKIATRNAYLIGAAAFILILLSLILKPWRWL